MTDLEIPESELYFTRRNPYKLAEEIRAKRPEAELLKRIRRGYKGKNLDETLKCIYALELSPFFSAEEINSFLKSLKITPQRKLLDYKSFLYLGNDGRYEHHINYEREGFRPSQLNGDLSSLEMGLRNDRADDWPAGRFRGMPLLLIAHEDLRKPVQELFDKYCK